MKAGFVEVPLSKLVMADWNYKKEDDLILEKLINNIKRNGQIENIIIRELDTGFFEVVNGNHRLRAMTAIGIEKVHCYNLGVISQTQAERIAIETNETKFPTDQFKLSELISEILIDFPIEELRDTMPYSEVDLDSLIELTNFDDTLAPVPEKPKPEKDDTPVMKEMKCPHCDFTWTVDLVDIEKQTKKEITDYRKNPPKEKVIGFKTAE